MISKLKELRTAKGFCETISELILRVNTGKLNGAVLNLLVQEPESHFKMFGRFRAFKPMAKVNASSVILPNREWNTWRSNTGVLAEELHVNRFLHAVGNCINF